jgi:putative transposase
VLAVCRAVGMTAQNYYARRRQRGRREVDVEMVLELVQAQRREQPRLGGRKVYYLIEPEMKKAGVKMGRDRVFEELKKAGLLVPRKPSEWPKTTQFNKNLPVFKNLIKNRKVTKPNQVWVADITYIRTEDRFLYLSLVTDQWSRKIVGFKLGQSLEVEVVLKALNMGLKTLKPGEKPIHHSDRGCQYASHAFVKRAKQAGLRMSMTETDHSAENAMAERVNGILKQEYWLDASFSTAQEAQQACAQAIRLYNTRRPHSALAMKTPEQVHHA